jgi:MFS family permease
MRKLWSDIGRDTRWVMRSYLLWGIGEGLWLFIQPLYVKSLGATPDQTGLVIGMWGLGRLLFILPAGILADRCGPRQLLLPLGWYLGLAGVVMIAIAPDWRWAAPGFLVYGFSAAAIPITNLYITQASRYDPTRRPDLPIQSALTLMWAMYSLGLVVTPTIGGWIGDQIGLRYVFMISVFWFVLSALAITRTHAYPRPERPAHGRDYRGLLRQRPIRLAFALLTLGFVAVLIGQPLSPQYLEDARHFSRTTIGTFGSLSALGTAVFSLMLGRLAAWRGFFAGLGLVLASFALFLVSGSPVVAAMAVFLLGAYYATRPLATSVISTYVPHHQHGVAFALVDTLAGLATLIGTNVAGALYEVDPGWPFGAGMIGISVVAGLGVLLVWLPARRRASVPAGYAQVEQGGK